MKTWWRQCGRAPSPSRSARSFFKKKWRKERFWFIVLYSALCGALSLYLWLNGWLALLAVLWLVAYCYLNNRA